MSTERKKPGRSRTSFTTSFSIEGAAKGYLTVSTYDNGAPCEVFLRFAKSGSTLQGVLDGLAIMISHALQYGMPLTEIIDALEGMRFPPFGLTNDTDAPSVDSICDYVAQKLKTFLPKE